MAVAFPSHYHLWYWTAAPQVISGIDPIQLRWFRTVIHWQQYRHSLGEHNGDDYPIDALSCCEQSAIFRIAHLINTMAEFAIMLQTKQFSFTPILLEELTVQRIQMIFL